VRWGALGLGHLGGRDWQGKVGTSKVTVSFAHGKPRHGTFRSSSHSQYNS
jgi:hypothetical protein